MESRERFFDLIIKIYALSQATRVYGLLYLEEVLEGIEPDFFREGLVMIINGTDPAEVAAYGKDFIAKAPSEGERFFREIGWEGLSRIQCGDHPVPLWLNLASRLGDDGFMAIKARLREFEIRKSGYFATLTTIPADRALTEEFASMIHDEFIFMTGTILMLTDAVTLGTALRGCAPDLQARVLQNLPMDEMLVLMDRPNTDPSPDETGAAMREIIEAYRKYA